MEQGKRGTEGWNWRGEVRDIPTKGLKSKVKITVVNTFYYKIGREPNKGSGVYGTGYKQRREQRVDSGVTIGAAKDSSPGETLSSSGN